MYAEPTAPVPHNLYAYKYICWLFRVCVCVLLARSCSCSPFVFSRTIVYKGHVMKDIASSGCALFYSACAVSLSRSPSLMPILSIYSSMCFRCLPSAIMSSLRRQHKYDKRAVIEYLMTWILIYESKRERITKERARISFNTSPNKYKFYVACFLHPICLSLLKII